MSTSKNIEQLNEQLQEIAEIKQEHNNFMDVLYKLNKLKERAKMFRNI